MKEQHIYIQTLLSTSALGRAETESPELLLRNKMPDNIPCRKKGDLCADCITNNCSELKLPPPKV